MVALPRTCNVSAQPVDTLARTTSPDVGKGNTMNGFYVGAAALGGAAVVLPAISGTASKRDESNAFTAALGSLGFTAGVMAPALVASEALPSRLWDGRRSAATTVAVAGASLLIGAAVATGSFYLSGGTSG